MGYCAERHGEAHQNGGGCPSYRNAKEVDIFLNALFRRNAKEVMVNDYIDRVSCDSIVSHPVRIVHH